MATSDQSNLPSPPPPTVQWVDNQGRPVQTFAQFISQLGPAIQSLISSLGSSSSSSGGGSNPTTKKPNKQTASYTLKLSDQSGIVEINSASANTLTIPLNSTTNFPIGATITIVQTGTGSTSLAAASGVTLESESSYTLFAGQYASVTLYQSALNTWVAYGNLAGAPVTAYYSSGTQSKLVASGTSAATNLASITLPAGNWMIWGAMYAILSSNLVYLEGVIALSASTMTPVNSDVFAKLRPYQVSGDDVGVPIGVTRVSIAANTTYYLNVQQLGISGGSNTVNGIISAELVN
ncbi:MAG: hypothetical protein P4M05_19590 [Bradyrhizobium sp.]|nr:hypothetical protein [Bradyrhizobium sp.]